MNCNYKLKLIKFLKSIWILALQIVSHLVSVFCLHTGYYKNLQVHILYTTYDKTENECWQF